MKQPVKFDNPPVVEVVFGVLFSSQNLLKSPHVGAFWERVKSTYPKIEDAAPIATIIDNSEIQVMEWDALPPLRRTWLIGDEGRKIIQIQQDRFLFNWKRALGDDDRYPSYEVNVKDFEDNLSIFETFLQEIGMDLPNYRQFELTYVNHITPSDDLSRLLVDHVRDSSRERFLPEPEGFNWVTSYSLPENAGRLRVSAQVFSNAPMEEKMVRLDLTARGISAGATITGRRQWFDMAHEWITQGFADVTASEFHQKIWKRTS